jgi:carbamoylphosphate synthase large subunit
MLYLICDQFVNGKGNDAIDYDIILYIPKIKIEEECMIHEGKEYRIKEEDTVVFSINEDGIHYIKQINYTMPQLVKETREMGNFVRRFTKNIYNDPEMIEKVADKYQTYKVCEGNINVPKSVDKMSKWGDEFPCIVTAKVASGGRYRDKVENRQEMHKCYNRIKANKGENNVMITSYIDSYVPELESYHNLRIMVINDTIIDWFYRPSDNWNIHTKTQNDKKVIAAEYYKKWSEENELKVNNFVRQMYKLYGKGGYSYDCIIENDEIYLCEIGYKFWDDTVAHKIKQVPKFTHNLKEYKKHITNIIRNN